MEEKQKVIGIMGLIALRKSELFYKVLEELSKKNQISEKDKDKIKKHISVIENERFLSKEEKRSKKINPELKLKDIELDIKKVIEELKF